MNDLTVYDLMGNDHYVFAKREKDNEITVEILDENDNTVYCEKGHEYAWEALVSFAKMVLTQNEVLQKE